MQANPTKFQPLASAGTLTLLAMLELLAFFPVVVLAHHVILHNSIWVCVIQLLACYWAGFIGGSTKLLTRVIYEAAYALAASSLLALWLQGSDWRGWLATIIGMIITMRGIRMTRTPWVLLFPVSAYIGGLIIYLIMVPVMHYYDPLKPYSEWANSLGLLALVVFFFYLHRLQLGHATLSNSRSAFSNLSASVRRINRIWIMLLILIIAIIGYLQQIQSLLFSMIRRIIIFLLGLSSDPEPIEEAPTASYTPSGSPPLIKGEPTWFTKLLNILFFIIGYALTAALVIFVLYMFYKKVVPAIQKAVRKLIQRSQLAGNQQEAYTGYSDEQEVLVEWKELPRAWLKGLSNRFVRKGASEHKWSQLTNNHERVRYLYRGLLRQASERGVPFHQARTPVENGREWTNKGLFPTSTANSIISLYNRVRYGGDHIQDQEMQQALDKTNSLFNQRKK